MVIHTEPLILDTSIEIYKLQQWMTEKQTMNVTWIKYDAKKPLAGTDDHAAREAKKKQERTNVMNNEHDFNKNYWKNE